MSTTLPLRSSAAPTGLASANITWHATRVDALERRRCIGHKSAVVWLTGLSASGKSTIATELECELTQRGVASCILDGDNLRHGLCSDLGFSPEARRENIRRAGEVARLMSDAGLVVLATFISPYRIDRELLRAKIENFIEVHVKCPVAVCQGRDPKGLYKKAVAGQIKEFTGISAPYEEPLKPELTLDTSSEDLAACVKRLSEHLDGVILS